MWLYLLLGLCCGMSEAIVVGNQSAVYQSGRADQLLPQESHERSAVYGDYYPENSLEPGFAYDHEHGHEHSHYPHHMSHHQQYHHHDSALRALLIPLAGVALLGAAAVFASNPILLQLGVVSGKRRRRRGVDLTNQRAMDIRILEEVMNQLPKGEVEREERRLLANYLGCGSAFACVERLTCELHRPEAISSPAELRVMGMIVSEILNNEFIDEEMKENITKARLIGISGSDCESIPCPELDFHKKAVGNSPKPT